MNPDPNYTTRFPYLEDYIRQVVWFEWVGFAAASALTAQLPGSHAAFPFAAGRLGLCALLAELDSLYLIPKYQLTNLFEM